MLRLAAAHLPRRFMASMSIHHDFGTPGLQEAPSALHGFAAGIEAWFCLPEHGMRELEILARGSLFLTPALSPKWPRSYHVVTAAHVTHPWLFRRFYAGPEHDWLDAVHQGAVQVRLTVREPVTGKIVHTIPLACSAPVRDNLDLAVFHIDGDEEALLAPAFAQSSLLPVALAAPPADSADGSPVVAVPDGTPTVLVGCSHMSDGTLVPAWLNGIVAGQADGALAVETRGALAVMGMCGGPALVQSGSEGVASAGLIFARVEAPHALEGRTLLVSSNEIRTVLRAVEAAQ